jgi:hypothetical protein
MALNGNAARKLPSWIDAFVELTQGIGTPKIFRRWAAVSVISSVIQEKIWVESERRIYANQYIFLVGPPAVGKSRTISMARRFVEEISDVTIAPTTLTGASLLICLNEALKQGSPLHGIKDFNSLYLMPSEMSAFIPEHDAAMVGLLTDLYDCTPYGKRLASKDINFTFENPQLSMLIGTTPSNLMEYMPKAAWSQGFASRVVFVFADEKNTVDMFAMAGKELPKEMLHDLHVIAQTYGRIQVTDSFREPLFKWMDSDRAPVPTHPKLVDYNTRRHMHLLKLAMTICVDESTGLVLEKRHLDKAMKWLFEAEGHVPSIFESGAVSADGQVVEDLYHMIQMKGGTVTDQWIKRKAGAITSALIAKQMPEIMEGNGMLQLVKVEAKTGIKVFKANGRGG